MPNALRKRFADPSSELSNKPKTVNQKSDESEKSKAVIKKVPGQELTPSKKKFPEIEPFFSLY
jgi:hypothetical protein